MYQYESAGLVSPAVCELTENSLINEKFTFIIIVYLHHTYRTALNNLHDIESYSLYNSSILIVKKNLRIVDRL